MRRRTLWLTPLLALLILGAVGSPAQAGLTRTKVHAYPALFDLQPVGIFFPNLHARLTVDRPQSEGAAPVGVPGQTIRFVVRVLGTGNPMVVCTATTNAQGLATCGGVVTEVRVAVGFGYRAIFGGSGSLAGSSDRGRLFELASL